MGGATAKNLGPPPGALGRSQKVKYHLISITKSISTIFILIFVCTHKWTIQNISDGIFILSPGSCPRGGTWGYWGAKIKFRPAVCPLCYLHLNRWTKFNQICCVSFSHEWGVQGKNVFGTAPWGPWEGSKDQISFFQLQSQFQRFLHQTLCVYSQIQDTKHIWRDLYSVTLAMP